MESAKKILTTKSMMSYAFGIFGVQALIGYINTYQAQFYSGHFGADLMVVAVIILCSKLISALADPFLGRIIDSANFKFKEPSKFKAVLWVQNMLQTGKMRPFVFLSALPFTIVTTIMFIKIPFTPGSAGMYVYITFMTVLWNICMSFADIPTQGMLSLLSPDGKERSGAAGIANIMKTIGIAAPSVVIPAISMAYSTKVLTPAVFITAALFFGVVGLILFFVMCTGTEEKVQSTRQSQTLKDMFKELRANKMLMIVFMTFMLGFGRNMGMGVMAQCAAILLRDGVFGMSGSQLPWLLGITAAISGMVSVIFAPKVNQKIGEKKTFISFAVYGIIACTISFLLFVLGKPGTFLRTVPLMLICLFFTGFMNGPVTYLPVIMVSDIVDYREWQTGKRQEGLQFAVLSLSIKISNAISVAVGIFIIGASGYTAKMTEGDITDKMQNIAWLTFILIPGVCSILAAIPMLFYKIDSKVKAEMRAALEERRKNADGETSGELVLEAAAAVENTSDEIK